MNEQEIEILDLLRHYWFVKGFITDRMMEKALTDLCCGKNPFLYLKEHFDHCFHDISWYANIWSIKLAHDK